MVEMIGGSIVDEMEKDNLFEKEKEMKALCICIDTNRAIHFALQFFISLKDLKNKKALNNNLLRQLF